MPELALALYALFLIVTFGVRTWLQFRRTGSSGFVGLSGRPGSVEWVGGVLFGLAVAIGFAAPLLQLAGVVEPLSQLDSSAGHAVGAILGVLGMIGVFAAQLAMGDAWRIGVDPDLRTELMTTGPFKIVRNPIYAAMLPMSLGIVLLVPNVVALIGFALFWLALELQTRAVEEPYLIAVHGETYTEYASRVGRFLPGVGRINRRVGERT